MIGRNLFPVAHAIEQDMVTAEMFVIGIGCNKPQIAPGTNTGLFFQFPAHGEIGRLSRLDAAAWQMPAPDIGVFYQYDAAIFALHNTANAQRRAAAQTPVGVHEGTDHRLQGYAPIHTDTAAGQLRMTALCTGVHRPETGPSYLGIIAMYALVALGLVAGLFALLNLIEYRRLD